MPAIGGVMDQMVSDQLARRGFTTSPSWTVRGNITPVTSLMVQMAGRRPHFRPRPFWSTESIISPLSTVG